MPNTADQWSDFIEVYNPGSSTRNNPDVVQLNNGYILVAWEDNFSGAPGGAAGTDIFGQLYDPIGNAVGSTFRLNQQSVANESDFELTVTPNGEVVLFYDRDGGNNPRFERFSFNAGTETLDSVSSTGLGTIGNGTAGTDNFLSTVALSDTAVIVAYEEDTSGGGESQSNVRYRLINPQTNTFGSEQNVDSATTFDSLGDADFDGYQDIHLARTGDATFSIVYIVKDEDGDGVRIKNYNTNGTLNFTTDIVGSKTGLDIQSVAASTNVVANTTNVAFVQDGVAKSAIVGPGGAIINGTIRTLSNTSDTVQDIEVADGFADGGFVAMWDNASGGGSIEGQRVNVLNNLVGVRFTADSGGSEGTPALALLEDGRFFTAWDDSAEIKAQFFDTRNEPNDPAVYMPDGYIIGTINDDSVSGAEAGSADYVFGWDGNDTLNDGDGSFQTLTDGGAGDDLIIMINVTDGENVSGGTGTDTLQLTTPSNNANFTVTLGGAGVVTQGASSFTAPNFQNFTYSGIANVNVNGSLGAGATGFNNIQTGNGDDTIDGLGVGDTLDGGAGDDSIFFRGIGSTVAGSLNGGIGRDLVTFLDNPFVAEETWSVDFTTSITTEVSSGDQIIIAQFEELKYDGVDNFFFTGDGDAELVDVDAGDDTLRGGGGDDTLRGGGGSNQLLGQGGDDSVVGGSDDDFISGGSGSDTIFASIGSDTIQGGDGADSMHGSGGTEDWVSYAGSTGGVTVNLDTQAASGSFAQGDTIAGFENITGSSQDDSLTGNGMINEINGGGGDDTIAGLVGADELDGETGFDMLNYAASSAAVNVNLGLTSASGGHAQGDSIANFEGVVGSDFSDILTGDGDSERFEGRKGQNTIDGGSGDDTIVGGGDAESLTGGAGFDWLDYSESDAGVNVAGGFNVASGGYAEGDTITGGFFAFVGSDFDDTILGNGTAVGNVVHAGDGNDEIDAGFGLSTRNDDIQGEAGDDTVIARAIDGTGVLDGGDDSDTLVLEEQTDAITFDMIAGTIGQSGDTMTAANFENFEYSTTFNPSDVTVNGTSGNNRIIISDTSILFGEHSVDGGAGNDSIVTGVGEDTIFGGTGNDTIEGGESADTMDGGDGVDTLSYRGSATGVIVNLTFGGAAGGASGDDFSNFENVLGTDFDDTLLGDANDNVLRGYGGNDLLVSGDGADTVFGDQGNDHIRVFAINAGGVYDGGSDIDLLDLTATGSASDPYVVDLTAGTTTRDGVVIFTISFENVDYVGSASVTVAGSDAANLVTLGNGSDSVDGGDGNDTVGSSLGADTIRGGDGLDTVDYSSSNAAISISFGPNTASGGHAEGDFVDGTTEIVIGSAFDDNISGSTSTTKNMFFGEAGNDTLSGGGGADTLDGGDGVDLASFVSGATGGVFVDVDDDEVINADSDTIIDIENVVGTFFDDTLVGGIATTFLSGLDGNDSIVGSAGDANLIGGNGVDWLSYGQSSIGVTVNLLTNATSGGHAANDTISGFENLEGTAFADNLTGDAGDNIIAGGRGSDTMEGGGGSDTLDYRSSDDGVTVDIALNTASGGHASFDVISNFEHIWGSEKADNLTGNASANTLDGDTGDDTLNGGAGDDTLDGGKGSDTASFVSASAAASVNLVLGTAVGSGSDVLLSIENLIGTSFDDTLIGDSGDNRIDGRGGEDFVDGKSGRDTLIGGTRTDELFGGSGNDQIFADAGNDRANGGSGADVIRGGGDNDLLVGGPDNDTLVGGAGSDSLTGGSQVDTADFGGALNAVTVDLAVGSATGEGNDTLQGIENVAGSAFDDTLRGDTGSNLLDGRGGEDFFDGKSGNDTLIGGTRADEMFGGSFNDSIDGQAGNDRANGGSGDDIIDGGGNNDLLIGGPGADTITGGSGADDLTGGSGDDVFVFDTGSGDDTITGFAAGVGSDDTIDFSSLGIDFADLTIAQQGADTLITTPGGDTVLLLSVAATGLDANDDFIF